MNVRRYPGTAVMIEKMGDEQRVVDAARVSIGGQKPNQNDEKLLKYLWSNGHTSPFEHVTITFRIECPLFTARQIMRHRTFSYNEVSGRYSELDLGYYMPRALYTQSTTSKQGTELEKVKDCEYALRKMETCIENADGRYRNLLNHGVSREQARMVLPVSAFTSFYMTGNLLNWIKFLKLRYDDHAQYEVWYIAAQIMGAIDIHFPRISKIVEEEVHGTERQMAKSRHIARSVQEGGLSGSSSETPSDAPTHSAEVFEAVRSANENWTPDGEA